jgi:hypothetical protein
MTFGQIPRNMEDILIEPSSTSVECVSKFVKIMQVFVTSTVTSIDQANKTAEGYANRSIWAFQFLQLTLYYFSLSTLYPKPSNIEK